jgi:hypothetical protein
VRLDHSALKVQRVQQQVGQLVLPVQQVQPEEVEDLASSEGCLVLQDPLALQEVVLVAASRQMVSSLLGLELSECARTFHQYQVCLRQQPVFHRLYRPAG